MRLVNELLAICGEPEWLVANDKLVSVIEYMLWETCKDGLGLHLAGASPCLFVDLDRMFALLYKALG